MSDISRRNIIAASAVGSLAASAAQAAPDRSISNIGPENAGVASVSRTEFKPPPTDHGGVPSFRYPFSAAWNRQQEGGWAREVTIKEFPISTSVAGVNMRLERGGVRELHWHKPAEWSYMIAGSARLTAIDQEGRHFAADVKAGDLWYFPGGVPHSIQGLGPDGCEFLLVFNDASFSENDTFLITDWLAHTPRDVLAKNFGVDASMLANLPKAERYIFPAPLPGPLAADLAASPRPFTPEPFNFALGDMAPQMSGGGAVRIADSKNFKASREIAAALVEVPPGGMRELHWHPNADEWQYYLGGRGRMTLFIAGGKAHTEEFHPGDIGYVPKSAGHYIENTGSEPLRFLEIFASDRYEDVSLTQWMANTPRALVMAHLNVSEAFLDHLSRDKHPIVA